MRRRIGLALLALLTFVASSELMLQVLSLAACAGVGLRGEENDPGAIRILAVGDSHTYGAPLPREDAYPAQLERRLAQELPDRRIQVLNRGVPGVNSAFVVNRLEELIVRHQPDLVIVWVGTNDSWNDLEAEGWGGSGLLDRLHRALLHVKLYRLYRVLQVSLSQDADVVAAPNRFVGYTVDGAAIAHRRPEGRLPSDEHAAGLALDLERIAGIARGLGRPVLFVTYPLATQATASDAIVQAGARLGVPVVDSRRSFDRARRDGYRTGDLIVMAAGPHPTRLLYRYAVEDMLTPVVEALGLRRQVKGPGEPGDATISDPAGASGSGSPGAPARSSR